MCLTAPIVPLHTPGAYSAKSPRQQSPCSAAAATKDLEIRLIDKFTAALKAMDDKFTAALKALDDKFTGQFKEHGERLARIEVKLDHDPNAEAA